MHESKYGWQIFSCSSRVHTHTRTYENYIGESNKICAASNAVRKLSLVVVLPHNILRIRRSITGFYSAAFYCLLLHIFFHSFFECQLHFALLLVPFLNEIYRPTPSWFVSTSFFNCVKEISLRRVQVFSISVIIVVSYIYLTDVITVLSQWLYSVWIDINFSTNKNKMQEKVFITKSTCFFEGCCTFRSLFSSDYQFLWLAFFFNKRRKKSSSLTLCWVRSDIKSFENVH